MSKVLTSIVELISNGGLLTVATAIISAALVAFVAQKRRPRANEPPMAPYWIPFIGE